MMDLTRIRSLKTLETMKRNLSDFLTNTEVPNVYTEDLKWGIEDYEADVDAVKELLEAIEKRMKSLSKYLSKESFPIEKEEKKTDVIPSVI